MENRFKTENRFGSPPEHFSDLQRNVINKALISLEIIPTADDQKGIIRYLTNDQLRKLWLITKREVWNGSQTEFTKTMAVNQGNFSKWLIGKKKSPVSAEAVRRFFLYGINVGDPLNLVKTQRDAIEDIVASNTNIVCIIDGDNCLGSFYQIISEQLEYKVHILILLSEQDSIHHIQKVVASLNLVQFNVSIVVCSQISENVDHRITAVATVLAGRLQSSIYVISSDKFRFATIDAVRSMFDVKIEELDGRSDDFMHCFRRLVARDKINQD